ncbi:adenylate/guanylate cyclase domain-containing protein [Inquilinus sp.]|jgi:adenylate cyclase|uniref:adenylate/guanylate cyclase domain-containing protein n=1 Tax=Inquilinus sp. TaxID=1932117 RepID=UPI00378399BE
MADPGSEVAAWLVAEGRLLADPVALVDGFCRRLIAAGLPLQRVRIGQSITHPLLTAWGVVWTTAKGGEDFVIDRKVLATSAFLGSPYEAVLTSRQPLRRSLAGLGPDDHTIFHELAEAGGTDYVAVPIIYGNATVQVASFVTDRPGGFTEAEVALLERLRHPLAAAMEPTAMRRSAASLLRTYLGVGPADRVAEGAIRRGDIVAVDAAILFVDMRGFTALSERLTSAAVLAVLDRYFETVAQAIVDRGGDVLKFLGDGVLAIFPVEQAGSAAAACDAAVGAVRAIRRGLAAGAEPVAVATALHLGPVLYGNIGSPDRLDFTVLGPAVNLTSRLEGLAKQLERPTVCSDTFRQAWGGSAEPLGAHPIRGLADSQPVFAIAA